MSYRLLRPLVFAFEAERAHGLALTALRCLQAVEPLRQALQRRAQPSPRLRQTVMGLEFPGPVGLAAGFDKDGAVVEAFAALGAGFVEVGTVTPRPQPGNPRPRMFRYPAQRSLRNCLGFNSRGMEAVAGNLGRRSPYALPVGINLGKNRDTALEAAEEDYAALFRHLGGLGDYFVLNVSSPNTPGLRDLQAVESLRRLVASGRAVSSAPILVKLAPDLDLDAAVELANAAIGAGAAGIIATNTTTDYGLLPGTPAEGGLSGAVLRQRSLRMLEALAPEVAGRAALVSVGGIESSADAYARIRCGASLLQLYTAMVYDGPGLFRRLHRELVELLDRDGLASLEEAVGIDIGRSAA